MGRSISSVFISYKFPENKTLHEKIIEIARLLGRTCPHVHFDGSSLRPGENIHSWERRCATESAFVLVLCTPDYAERTVSGTGGVGREFAIIATRVQKHIDAHGVVPILLDGDEDAAIPSPLKNLKYIDFRHKDWTKAAFSRLLDVLFLAAKYHPLDNWAYARSQALTKLREFIHVKPGAPGIIEISQLSRLRELADMGSWVFANTEDLARNAAEINANAFSQTSLWSDTVESKFRRNFAHSRRNDKCVMLVGSPHVTGAWVGLTHIIPINSKVLRLYLEGQVHDRDFPADYVCRPEEEPEAFLLFTIAIDGREVAQRGGGHLTSQTHVQWAALAALYHLTELASVYDKSMFSVYLQRGCAKLVTRVFLRRLGMVLPTGANGSPLQSADRFDIATAGVQIQDA